MKKFDVKKSFSSGTFKKGSYSATLSAIVIAVIVAINLVASQLPDSVKSIDLSSQQYYTLSEDTKDILRNLDDKITIYQFTAKGNEDSTITKLLSKYEALTDKIEVTNLDPDLNPGLVTKYEATELSENSLIVVNGDKKKLIDYSEIYETDYSAYYTTGTTSTDFDGEGEITSAINYVTSEKLPKIYKLKGHDEQKLSNTLTESISKQNIETEELNLLTASDVPEDCDVLAIIAPAKDCSKDEADSVIKYLENGGKAMIVMNYYYSQGDLPNFDTILEAYGVALQPGYISEENQEYYFRQGYYLLPQVANHDITASFYQNMYIMAPISQGILKLDDVRETVNIEDLLTTSEQSFADVDYGAQITDEGVTIKSADDKEGPFPIAVAITEEQDDKKTQLVVYGSYVMFTEDITGAYSLGNVDMFANSISWMCDTESAKIVNIEAKSMDVPQNTVDNSKANLCTAFFVIIIPLGVVAAGFIVWYRRRRA